MSSFKIGDEVFVIDEGWIGVITDIPDCSRLFPEDYRIRKLDSELYGLCNPKYLRKLTKLDKALK